MDDRFDSVVILTALGLERSAVVTHLQDRAEREHSSGTIYDVGSFETDESAIDVAVAEIGAGNAGAAVHVERAVGMFAPKLIMFVGVAGGLKDVQRGDVVVASKIYGYESVKADTEFMTRPAAYLLPHRIDQRVRRLMGSTDWRDGIDGDLSTSPPDVYLGPIAAGDAVLSSTSSPLYTFLKKNYNDALAIEMEGRGFLEGAYLNALPAVVVRGVSDLVDDKSPDADQEWQPAAAQSAAAFAFALLGSLGTVTPPLAEGSTETLTAVTAHAASAYYINVPTLLSDPSALGLLSEQTLEALSGARSWRDLDWQLALRLRALSETALAHWEAPAVPLEAALEKDLVGARVTFDHLFRTKNWSKYDKGVGLTGNLARDPHIYTNVGSLRVVMPLEPSWVTTTTGTVMFTSGSVRLSGVGVLRELDERRALVSPVVLAPPVAASELRAAILGKGG